MRKRAVTKPRTLICLCLNERIARTLEIVVFDEEPKTEWESNGNSFIGFLILIVGNMFVGFGLWALADRGEPFGMTLCFALGVTLGIVGLVLMIGSMGFRYLRIWLSRYI